MTEPTPDEEQRGRERFATFIVAFVIPAEIAVVAFTAWGLHYLGIFR